MGSGLRTGILFHLGLLAVDMQSKGHLAASSPSPLFTVYVAGACLLILGIIWWMGLRSLPRGGSADTWRPDLALALLPFLAIPFGASKENALLFAGVVILYGAWESRSGLQEWRERFIRLGRKEWVFIAGVLILAMGMRAASGWRMGHLPTTDLLGNFDDAFEYHDRALAVAMQWSPPQEKWKNAPRSTRAGMIHKLGIALDGEHNHGYILTLAAFYTLVGIHFPLLMAIQGAVGALAAVIVFFLAKRLFGPAAAKVAGLLVALSQLQIFYSVAIAREIWGILLYASLILMLLQIRARPEASWRFLLFGWALGMSILTDQAMMVVGLFAAVWLLKFVRFPANRRSARCAAMRTGLVLLGLAIAYLPPVLSEQARTGRWAFPARAPHGARNMWTNNAMYKDLKRAGFAPYEDLGGSLKAIVDRPLRISYLFAKKVAIEFKRSFFEENQGTFDPIFLRKGSYFSRSLMFYAFGFTFLGVYLGFRSNIPRPEKWILYGFPLCHVGVYVVLLATKLRYSAGIEPILLILTALGIVSAARWTSGNPPHPAA
jgi:hypothetical protein